MTRAAGIALAAILVVGLALRLYHLHNPILDHPAWRQGDEAAIARNFLELRNNILYPQTDYNGPPPNYVELELQLVPYAAAQVYRVAGIHEVFARLFVIAFSLGCIPLLFVLGWELYSLRAGLFAAAWFAVAPGAVYYGRAIIPESDMLFFSIGALLFWCRFARTRAAADFWLAAAFAALALLAKPPAIVILAPMMALAFVRARDASAGNTQRWAPLALLAITLVPLWLYYGHLHRIAEWHWATGITGLHVIPALLARLSSPAAFIAGLGGMLALLKMLATTILGPALFGLVLVATVTQPRDNRAFERAVFFGAWIGALALYAFVVVNVERVDYYLMPFVPFAVLYAAGGLDYLLSLVAPNGMSRVALTASCVAAFIGIYAGMLEVHPYYTWSRAVFAAANEVRATLPPGTLIVMGHYDPSVLYTIGHRGWEEDPYLWTVADTLSAMRKGARYFVAVEVPRLRANKQLYAFLLGYRRVPVRSGWQVYDLTQRSALKVPTPQLNVLTPQPKVPTSQRKVHVLHELLRGLAIVPAPAPPPERPPLSHRIERDRGTR
ncbi:MAG: glycosyltransferase family 39 protein [Candidatus Eremiobacteraeota bacterium]|nr:glycosyltransferase family 39 protein [Candidatus Eremiobacteraeota bacterium]